MAMFLGRNYLDQSDRPEAEQSGAKDVPSAVQRLKVMLANAVLGSKWDYAGAATSGVRG